MSGTSGTADAKEGSKANYPARKVKYWSKFLRLVQTYNRAMVIGADFVSSSQLMTVRKRLRGLGEIVMGKNTIMRRILREEAEKNPSLKVLIPWIVGNVGLIFCNGDLSAVRKILKEERVPAAARPGTLAVTTVVVPAGPTGLEPTTTNFFQALNIPTKIMKGQIDILEDVQLFSAGDKVTAGAAALLSKLNIKPFTYGLSMEQVWDRGVLYEADLLDLDPNEIMTKFMNGVSRVTAISLALNMPTLVSIPHVVRRAYKNVLSISVGTDYTFERAAKIKELIANPELAAAMARAAAPAAAPAAAAASKAAPAAKAKEPEPEPKSEEEMDFGLFD